MNVFNQTSASASLGKRLTKCTEKFNPIRYRNTGLGNWYEQDSADRDFNTCFHDVVPRRVQLEYCYKAKIVSDHLLTFNNEQGILKALTGIRKTLIPNWYYGEIRLFEPRRTVVCLVLVAFTKDRSSFDLFLMYGYYPGGSKRIRSIINIIQQLESTGLLPSHVMAVIESNRPQLIGSSQLKSSENDGED